jgi:glycosyltransferase involved in cell wall biosynthesis
MINEWRRGFDLVYGVRKKRIGETWFKKLTAAAFYRILRLLLGFEVPVDTGDFRFVSRPVVLPLRSLRERHLFIRGIVNWIDFRQTAVYYERMGLLAREAKFYLHKKLTFAVDGITSFSIIPLRIATWLGVLAGLGAIAIAGWARYEKLVNSAVVQGWTAIMILVALGSSAQLLMTGILGEYIGRIFEEVKQRPLYTVADEINLSSSFTIPFRSRGGLAIDNGQ